MEQLLPHVRAFYSATLAASERAHLHSLLLSTLTSSSYQRAALQYLQTVTSSPSQADPLLLHHTLTILNSLASAPSTPTTDLAALSSLLFSFIVAAYAANLRSRPAIPHHSINRAAAILAHLTHRSDQPAHQIAALLATGPETATALPLHHARATVLAAVLQPPLRPRLLANATRAFRQALILHSEQVLAALELAIRMRGPSVLPHVPVAAVTSLSALLRQVNQIAPSVSHVLTRCLRHRFDALAAHMFTVLPEICAHKHPPPHVRAAVTLALERLAMGDEAHTRFVPAIATAAEQILSFAPTETELNAVMGVSKRALAHSPAWLPCMLDIWIAVFDATGFQSAPQQLIEKVLTAVAILCFNAISSSALLNRLLDTQISPPVVIAKPALVAEAAANISLTSALFVADNDESDEHPFDDEFDVSRVHFLNKCVDTVVAVINLNPALAPQVAQFVAQNLPNSSSPTFAIALVRLIAAISPALSPHHALALLPTLINLVSANSNHHVLVHTVFRSIIQLNAHSHLQLPHNVLQLAKEGLMSSSVCVAAPAALLLVALAPKTAVSAPIEITTVLSTPHNFVACLGAASLARAALVPPRNEKGLPTRWEESDWQQRVSSCASAFHPILSEFEAHINISPTESGLKRLQVVDVALRTATLALFSVQGRTQVGGWAAFGKRYAEGLVAGVIKLISVVGDKRLDDDVRRAAISSIHSFTESTNAVLRTYRRQAGVEAPGLATKVLDTILPVAQGANATKVATAALTLVRDQISEEVLVLPGIRLAMDVIKVGEEEASLAALGVLGEALKRHWLIFWPGDVPQGVTPRRENEAMKGLFFMALEAILTGLRSKELALCREAFLILQALDAAKKLFSRKDAFRTAGAAKSVIYECFDVLGFGGEQRESLSDEAVEVVWGIAKVDFGEFDNIVRELVASITADVGRFRGEGRSNFGRWIADFVNDCIYWMDLKKGPSFG